MGGKFKFSIDRGGTFTDVWSQLPNGKTRVLKLLSEDPDNYEDAPREAIRRIIQDYIRKPIAQHEKLDASNIEWIRMGTTVATNALLERKGEKTALVVTKNFKDLLHIGNQSRPSIFDLQVKCPEVLYEEIVEVDERVILCQDNSSLPNEGQVKRSTGKTGEDVEIWEEIDEARIREQLVEVRKKGIKSLAILFLHSYMFPNHEEQVGRIAKEVGFEQVSLSSHVMPMIRAVPRGYTACADAYLTPKIKTYIENFSNGFSKMEDQTKVLFMQSDGGLTPTHKFTGSRAVLSGPAGGVVGYAMTTFNEDTKQPVIGFDMGGTSTDVSRYAGAYEHVWESTTAGVTIQAPQLDINTVAAGGGSRLFFRSEMYVVGPESAGAHPGPVCYKKGGYLTITDANLILGRLLPQYFPKIFGPNENESLDKDSTERAFEALKDQINNETGSRLTIEEVAMGFLKVANESMCRPIRAITQAKGHDTARHVLACFGGAGGQHACAIARALGIKTVFIHKYGGILSAFGLALADVVEETQEPCALYLSYDSFDKVNNRIDALQEQCIAKLKEQKFKPEDIEIEVFLNLRYDRTDCSLMISCGKNIRGDVNYFEEKFTEKYKQEFGFTVPGRKICIDDIRIRGVGKSDVLDETLLDFTNEIAKPIDECLCYFNGWRKTNVYTLQTLQAGQKLSGPAILIDQTSTIVVEPDCQVQITRKGDVRIDIEPEKMPETVGTELDPIQLSIFSHRFMSIAEQMGRVLQRTSISTNIKERLDFSCALFGSNGGLVANAPHIPVHLGAMQETVQFQMKNVGDQLKDGDVLLSNHPTAGGSHLPDLTVITPVFYRKSKKPVFFVASRGHHADIGGSTPGSMPPNSKSIFEEGAVFKSFFLVRDGKFMEEEVTAAFNDPARYENCSGTRNLHDNLSDLKAQVAANHKGIKLVCELIDEYSLETVEAYMQHIQNNAEIAVRNMLKEIAERYASSSDTCTLKAEDKMDCEATIKLSVEIDRLTGSTIADFTGTSPQLENNLNAPRAVTLSALIYCLRCMVGYDVPLNQGCLIPIKPIIPANSLLDPNEHAAVVGGNVLTSQRIVDVILKAFRYCSASQGCMNNVTFGDETVGYYETVAGGAGAGPGWHGRSGVHTHMTNTRITDPEIVEKRYPVIVKRFDLRKNSGGKGKYRGGDGVVRELLFRKDLILSVLSERRTYAPYGMNGGEEGVKGRNIIIRANGDTREYSGMVSAEVKPGDLFRLLTPGGGGYGDED